MNFRAQHAISNPRYLKLSYLGLWLLGGAFFSQSKDMEYSVFLYFIKTTISFSLFFGYDCHGIDSFQGYLKSPKLIKIKIKLGFLLKHTIFTVVIDFEMTGSSH